VAQMTKVQVTLYLESHLRGGAEITGKGVSEGIRELIARRATGREEGGGGGEEKGLVTGLDPPPMAHSDHHEKTERGENPTNSSTSSDQSHFQVRMQPRC